MIFNRLCLFSFLCSKLPLVTEEPFVLLLFFQVYKLQLLYLMLVFKFLSEIQHIVRWLPCYWSSSYHLFKSLTCYTSLAFWWSNKRCVTLCLCSLFKSKEAISWLWSEQGFSASASMKSSPYTFFSIHIHEECFILLI